MATAVEVPDAARVERSHAFTWIAATGLFVFGLNIFLSRDLFWDSYLDLAGGRFIVHHRIPHHEVWTVAGQGRPWIDQQWLAHVAYYLAWSAGGYALVALLSTALIAGAFAGLAALLSSRGVAPQRAALWSIGGYGACVGSTVIRAQSFAFPLFVALLALVVRQLRTREPGWELVAMVALLVLWANVHGTVLLAATLVVVFCVARALGSVRLRTGRAAAAYGAAAIAAGLAFAANPYGFGVITYYRSLIGNSVVAMHILEWSPPSLGYVVSWGFFVVLLLVVAALAYARGRAVRLEPLEVVLVALLGLLATQGVRYQVWFTIAGVSFAATAFAAAGRRPPPLSERFVRLLGAAAVAVAAFAAVTLFATTDARFEQQTPRGAIAATAGYLAQHPRSRVLADDSSASALLWLDPASAGRVGFDARLEQFRRSDLKAWFEFVDVTGPDWLRVTRGYDVLLAAKQNDRLVSHLRGLRGWRRLYDAHDGVVLVRG